MRRQRSQPGDWRSDVCSSDCTDLFAYAWQNALTLALTGVFVGLCWLVLWLWASLFRLTGISYFSDLFSAEPFVYMATGFMAGLGILIARLQRRVLAVTRQILFAICLGLLSLLAAVIIGFLSPQIGRASCRERVW